MKKALVVVFGCSLSHLAVAQAGPNGGIPYPGPGTYVGYTPHLIQEVVLELYADHVNGLSIGPEIIPPGSKTYRLYLKMTNQTDFVTAIGAQIGCSWTMHYTSSSGFFNSTFGGMTAQNINPGLFGFIPSAQYDTFATFKAENQLETCGSNSTMFSPYSPENGSNPTQTFNSPGDSWINHNGGYFTLNASNPCGFASGPNNLLLIGQFTTNGPGVFSYQMGAISVIEGAVSGQTQAYYGGFTPNSCDTYSQTTQYFEDASGIPGWCGSSNGGSCEIIGCTDTSACNYFPAATTDDGSCLFATGCSNPSACNYEPDVCSSASACVFPGCTDPAATNYNPAAGCDDGSCILPCQGACAVDFNDDGIINFVDLNLMLNNFGCMGSCTGDINNDGIVSFTDVSIFFSLVGCICP